MLKTNHKTTSRWITTIRSSREARCRLFCFPYAGAGSTIFRPWPAHLPGEVDIYSIQPPGRETRLREQPYSRMSDLVKALTEVIRPYIDMPFAFFGHCVGALVAFELARELTRKSHPAPRHLFVSGFRSPDFPNPNRVLHNLPESELMCELRRYGGTSDVTLQDATSMNRLVPTIRADFALHETYAYSSDEKLACPISVFGGLQDGLVSYDHLVGWLGKTSCHATIRMFPGGHFFLISHRYLLLETVSQELRQLIDKGNGAGCG